MAKAGPFWRLVMCLMGSRSSGKDEAYRLPGNEGNCLDELAKFMVNIQF